MSLKNKNIAKISKQKYRKRAKKIRSIAYNSIYMSYVAGKNASLPNEKFHNNFFFSKKMNK